MLNIIYPSFTFKNKEKIPTWMKHWRDDPNDMSNLISVNSVLKVDEATELLANEIVRKVKKTPLLMITAGKDTVCCSQASKQFFINSLVEDKQIIELDDATHELVNDQEYASMVVKEAIAWQNIHIY